MFKDYDGISHINGSDLTKLMREKQINVIDIREPFEVDICSVPGTVKIPMYTLLRGFESILDKKEDYYILCHTGQRSYFVTDTLTKQGYNVINVMGGIASVEEYNVPY